MKANLHLHLGRRIDVKPVVEEDPAEAPSPREEGVSQIELIQQAVQTMFMEYSQNPPIHIIPVEVVNHDRGVCVRHYDQDGQLVEESYFGRSTSFILRGWGEETVQFTSTHSETGAYRLSDLRKRSIKLVVYANEMTVTFLRPRSLTVD